MALDASASVTTEQELKFAEVALRVVALTGVGSTASAAVATPKRVVAVAIVQVIRRTLIHPSSEYPRLKASLVRGS
jgi:hypothetical protein